MQRASYWPPMRKIQGSPLELLWHHTGSVIIGQGGSYTLVTWKSLSYVQLFATPWIDCSLPGSSVCRILQARILEWVAIPFSGGSSWPRHQTGVPALHESEKWKGSCSVVSDSSDRMDCSLPGSSVHGIFQAIVLEWIAISFSRGLSQPDRKSVV